ncbi:MAG TPA: ABC transporter permease, partial [Pseudoxanthomonas sp.]|nr:ABC transporter permease [Pseudoxanthomonas sp.]
MDTRRAPPKDAGHAGMPGGHWRLPHRLIAPHAGMALVLVLEVAVACVLWQLAWQAFAHWQTLAQADSGIEEQRVLVVPPLGTGPLATNATRIARDQLSAIDGVERVARVNQVPYGNNSWNTVVRRERWSTSTLPVSTTFGDVSLAPTLGLRLLEGRLLQPEDYGHADTMWQQPGEMPVLITHGLAQRLYPQQSAVGRIVHGPTRRLRVVGVVAGLPIPNGSRQLDVAADSQLILPAIADDPGYVHYLVRVSPGRQAQVVTAIQRMLAQQFPGRSIKVPLRLAELRPATLHAEQRCAITWAGCALAWSLLTLLSLAAAELLWVQRSASRISLHRALGASRAQVRGSVHWDLLRLVMAGGLLG